MTFGNGGSSASVDVAARDGHYARPWWQLPESTLLPLISFGAFFALWELAARLEWINPFFFSSPVDVFLAGLAEIGEASFWNDVWTSSYEFLAGYLGAVGTGIAFGLVTGWYRRAAYFFDPWLAAFNAMPRIALLPLIVLWLGIGVWSKIAIVFLGVFFPVALNTFHGVRTVDRDHLQVALSYGASQSKLFQTVILPSVVPFVMTGARIGVGRAVAGVVVGEFYTAQAGLAHRIFRAGQQFQTAEVLFGTLVITVLALGVYTAVRAVESRVTQRRGTLKSER